jgi:hypothetical protein
LRAEVDSSDGKDIISGSDQRRWYYEDGFISDTTLV